MLNFIKTAGIAICCSVVHVTQAQDAVRAESFIQETQERILAKLQENAQAAGEDGEPLLTCIRDFQAPRHSVKWKLEEAAAFEKKTFAANRAFRYAYIRENVHVVHLEKVRALLQMTAADTRLEPETNALLSEMARSMGEQMMRLNCGDFRSYWCSTRSNAVKKPIPQHLYDAQGRVNPVALYGLYTEYMMRRNVAADAGWHDFVAKQAEQDAEYQKMAETAKQYYPEGGKDLRRMLGYEASWSACWVMAKKALLEYCGPDKDAKEEGLEIAQRVNQYIQDLATAQLPEAQKNYIHNKYPMDKLADGLNVPPEVLAKLEAAEAELQILSPQNAEKAKQLAFEREREKRLVGVCKMSADYVRLLQKDSAWKLKMEHGEWVNQDPETEKLVHEVLAELFRIFVDRQEEINELLALVKDKETADKYAPLILQKQREAGVACMHMNQMQRSSDSGRYTIFAPYVKSCSLMNSGAMGSAEQGQYQLLKRAAESAIIYMAHVERCDNTRNEDMSKPVYGSEALQHALHDLHRSGSYRSNNYPQYQYFDNVNPHAAADDLRALLFMWGMSMK